MLRCGPDPTAAVVKCSRLFGCVLQLGSVAATGMPQRDDLNGTGRGLDEPIVQVIVDATQENPAHTGEANVTGGRPRVGLRDDELQRLGEFLAQGARRLCSIGVPPTPASSTCLAARRVKRTGRREMTRGSEARAELLQQEPFRPCRLLPAIREAQPLPLDRG
jgi:hypothetical protein